jgi:hypothetical protein
VPDGGAARRPSARLGPWWRVGHHDEAPRLAVPDRRRHVRRREHAPHELGVDGVWAVAAYVPTGAEDLLEGLPSGRREGPSLNLGGTFGRRGRVAAARYGPLPRHGARV